MELKDSENQILENLKTGGKLIFIRHAWFHKLILMILTQRNLSDSGESNLKIEIF